MISFAHCLQQIEWIILRYGKIVVLYSCVSFCSSCCQDNNFINLLKIIFEFRFYPQSTCVLSVGFCYSHINIVETGWKSETLCYLVEIFLKSNMTYLRYRLIWKSIIHTDDNSYLIKFYASGCTQYRHVFTLETLFSHSWPGLKVWNKGFLF